MVSIPMESIPMESIPIESIPMESISMESIPIELTKSHFLKVNVDIVVPGSSVWISKQFKIVLIFIIINYKLWFSVG